MPQGGDLVLRLRSLLPKIFMGLRCWSIFVLQLCFSPVALVANERRLLAQARGVRCTQDGEDDA